MDKNKRTYFLDFFKAIATQFIVLHHLSSYGIFSQLLESSFLTIKYFFFDYGRLFVQVFLVLGGFLAGVKLTKTNNVLIEIIKRYLRLAVPMMLAISLMITVSTSIKFNLDNLTDWNWLTNLHSFLQIFSHIILAQDLLHQESLSTGVWYVAIDFQLFIMVMCLCLIYKISSRDILIKTIYALIITSLFFTPSQYDNIAIYFFYSYGLGLLIYCIKHAKNVIYHFLFITLLFSIALFIDFKIRVLLAYLCASILLLVIKMHYDHKFFSNKLFTFLSKNSYSTFLTHFSIVMILNFIVGKNIALLSSQPTYIILLLLISWIVSIFVGQLFFKLIENPILKKINKLKFHH